MKRQALLRYLRQQGCDLLREDGRHSWWWNPANNHRTAIPRHTEVPDLLANKICQDLGVEKVK